MKNTALMENSGCKGRDRKSRQTATARWYDGMVAWLRLHRRPAVSRDKILGTVFGLAVGDALGLGTEGMTAEEAKACYPDGLHDYAQILQDCHRSRWQRGEWTDDTDMTLCILKSFVVEQRVDCADIARRFKAWRDGGGRGIGRTVNKVLSFADYLENPQQAAQIVEKLSRNAAASNGSLMRTPVVGLLREGVARYAGEIGRLTHTDPLCVSSCVILSEMVHALVYEDRVMDFRELHPFMTGDGKMERCIDLAWRGDATHGVRCLQLDEEGRYGYVLKTLSAALWACWHAEGFEQGVLAVVNAGGDADTNAAVAGAVLGAKFGYKAIPERWVQGLCGRDGLMTCVNSFVSSLPQFVYD